MTSFTFPVLKSFQSSKISETHYQKQRHPPKEALQASFEWHHCGLSVLAQTTLYNQTKPTEGYLIVWTPFATKSKETPTQNGFESLESLKNCLFANYVHSPVCHSVRQGWQFPHVFAQNYFFGCALHYLMYSDRNSNRARDQNASCQDTNAVAAGHNRKERSFSHGTHIMQCRRSV